MFRAVLALLASLLFIAAAVADEEPRRITVPLTDRDRASVGTQACAPYEVAAERVGEAYRWSSDKAVHVVVRCATHASVAKRPAHYDVNCLRRNGNWLCQPGREVISVQTHLGYVEVEPGSFSHQQAIHAVQAAASSDRYRAQIEQGLLSGCGLYVDVTSRMDEVVDLSCKSGRSFLISFWCPRGPCPRVLTMR